MPNREHYMKCLLIGGLALGLLSGTPIIGAFNCFCCMWVILGGGLAAYLLVRWASIPVSSGEGALVGMMSGAFGAVIITIMEALQFAAMGPEKFRMQIEEAMSGGPGEVPPGFEEFMEQFMDMMYNPALMLFIILIFSVVIFSVFGTIGGILSVAIFGPRKFPPYGWPQGGYPPAQGGPGVYIPPPVVPQPPPPPGGAQGTPRFPGPGPGQRQ